MTEQRVQRRLATILAADVVGYSRLMREDETGTLAQLKTLRKEVFDPRIAEHNGHIVKTMGDGCWSSSRARSTPLIARSGSSRPRAPASRLPKSESNSQGYEGQTVRSLQKRLLENCENRCQINTIRVVHEGRAR